MKKSKDTNKKSSDEDRFKLEKESKKRKKRRERGETDDPDAAMAFHFKHFGWTKGDPIPMGEAGVYQLFNQGESAIGAIMRRSPQAPSCWSYYFRVPSIAAAKERVETAGGTVIVGPMEVPGGDEILVCTDPQGAMFCLVGKSGTA